MHDSFLSKKITEPNVPLFFATLKQIKKIKLQLVIVNYYFILFFKRLYKQ